jgi:uncharacterized membrane protein YfcA
VLSALALLAGLRLRRSSATVAGFLSGVTNTIAGIGGPVVAIHALNENWPADERRATFQLYFLLLNGAGLIALGPRWPSPVLLVGLAAGFALGRVVAPRVPEHAARSVTLVLAIAGGLVAAGRGLF